jgi:acetyltransferase-like isoleucine patch superfamily enzyme
MLHLFHGLLKSIEVRLRKRLTRFRYAGLHIGRGVNLDVMGGFRFGRRCVVSEGANIIVPKHAELLLGEGCYIGRYVELGPGGIIEIGKDTSIQDRSILVGDVKVGRHCIFSLNVLITSGRHYYALFPAWLIRDQDGYIAKIEELSAARSRPVVVEDDCWLGVNSVVMPGITIGKGAVVGANSVVTHDVYPYTVVAGAPARAVKKRLDFVPPQYIAYDNPNDWPYFYSGCEMNQTSLDIYTQYGGVAAGNDFTVCLDASAGTSIHLLIKTLLIHVEKKFISYYDEAQEIADHFKEIVFYCNELSVKTNRFRMRTNVGEAQLIIQKAWIA